MTKLLIYLLGKRCRMVRIWYWSTRRRWLWGVYQWHRDNHAHFLGES